MVEKREFITADASKPVKCIACWREFQKGDAVVILVVDDVAWVNSVYCPSYIGHIESLNEYQEHVKINNPKITQAELFKRGTHWEVHRIRKGYASWVNVEKVTKEHKEIYNSMLEYQRKQKIRDLDRLTKIHKRQKDEIVQELVKLAEEQENFDDK